MVRFQLAEDGYMNMVVQTSSPLNKLRLRNLEATTVFWMCFAFKDKLR